MGGMKTTRKPAKPRPDWEAIERDYRSGRVSIRKVAEAHGVSDKAVRNRAKAAEWTRDLSEQVLTEARAKAIRAAVRDPGRVPSTDADLVEQAAATTAEVMIGHRKDLQRLAAVEGKLEQAIARFTDISEGTDGKGLVLMLEDVHRLSATIWNLVRAKGRRIELERKAWNLDGVTSDDQQSLIRSLTGQVDTSMLERLEAAIRDSGE